MLLRRACNFKTYELFISGIFHLIFLDCSCLRVAETVESKTAYGGATVLPKFSRASNYPGILLNLSSDVQEFEFLTSFHIRMMLLVHEQHWLVRASRRK